MAFMDSQSGDAISQTSITSPPLLSIPIVRQQKIIFGKGGVGTVVFSQAPKVRPETPQPPFSPVRLVQLKKNESGFVASHPFTIKL
jgi:hypothetical protein